MISRNIKKEKKVFPAIEGIGGPSILGRIKLKNLYQNWRGENFAEITASTVGNPFNLRIGLPQTDKQLKDDRIFLFTKYLAYNPLTKQIEKRELLPLRNVERVYIGQSPEEHHYSDYKLFVDGKIVVEDVVFKQPNTLIGSLVEKLQKLEEKVSFLEQQLQKTITNTESKAIYNQ